MRAPTNAMSHDGALRCVGVVDWALEWVDYSGSVSSSVDEEKGETEGLHGGFYR